jgi:hypothetical protein
MTGSPSGSSRGRVASPVAARLLLDGRTRDVLGVFLGRERSVREAATELGRDLDAVLYRVRRLVAAGVLTVVGERRRGGRPIKLYRSTFDAYFVPFEVLPYADVEEALTELQVAQAQRVARATARYVVRTPWAGFFVERRDDGRVWLYGASGEVPGAASDAASTLPVPLSAPTAGAMDATVELRLTDAEARALNADLAALLSRFMALSTDREAAPNRLLSVASVPLDEP